MVRWLRAGSVSLQHICCGLAWSGCRVWFHCGASQSKRVVTAIDKKLGLLLSNLPTIQRYSASNSYGVVKLLNCNLNCKLLTNYYYNANNGLFPFWGLISYCFELIKKKTNNKTTNIFHTAREVECSIFSHTTFTRVNHFDAPFQAAGNTNGFNQTGGTTIGT